MISERIGLISLWLYPPLIFTGLVYHFQDLFLKVRCKYLIKLFILIMDSAKILDSNNKIYFMKIKGQELLLISKLT